MKKFWGVVLASVVCLVMASPVWGQSQVTTGTIQASSTTFRRIGIPALLVSAFFGAAHTTAIAHARPGVAQAHQPNADLNDKLGEAVDRGQTERVRSLLKAGANPNLRNDRGWVALLSAAGRGYEAIVRALIDAGADANARDPRGNTALMFASGKGHLGIVQALLAKGADVNAKQADGWTALMTAAAQGQADVVKVLLQNGAAPNVRGRDGSTPLTLAVVMQDSSVKGAITSQTEMVKLLLSKAADPKAKGKYGMNALALATARAQIMVNPKLEQLLKSAGGEPDPREARLVEAAAKGDNEKVQTLLKAGVDPNAIDDYYVSALERAAQGKHADIVRLLIAAGADVNFTNIYGGTPLGAAKQPGAEDIVDLLKKAGATKYSGPPEQ